MNKKKILLVLLTVAMLVLLDQITKHLAVAYLSGNKIFKVIGDWLRFILVYNKDAAFSISYGTPELRTFFMAIATIVIFIYLVYSLAKNFPYYYLLCLSLILSGGIGNLIDRLRIGKVVDFIQMGIAPLNLYWPVYNLADSYVVIGVSIIILKEYNEHRKNKNNK